MVLSDADEARVARMTEELVGMRMMVDVVGYMGARVYGYECLVKR